LLDGKISNFDKNDMQRRNTIATLLSDWGLITFAKIEDLSCSPMNQIKIISYKEKPEWELTPKYNIGFKRAEE